jgi:hypothetical protein
MPESCTTDVYDSPAMGRAKIRAQSCVAKAVKRGVLPSPWACEVCGRTKNVVYHHASYLKQHVLDVVPLCRSCHVKVHRRIIPDPGLRFLAQIEIVLEATLVEPPASLPLSPGDWEILERLARQRKAAFGW